jgi:hypothetical protein
MPITTRTCLSNFSPQFNEYRGTTEPDQGIGCGGDVFLDVAKHRIWYFSKDGWEPWHGIIRSAIHPVDIDRFLAPREDGFVWAHSGMYADAKVKARGIFGTQWSVKDVLEKYTQDTQGSSKNIFHASKMTHRQTERAQCPSKDQDPRQQQPSGPNLISSSSRTKV